MRAVLLVCVGGEKVMKPTHTSHPPTTTQTPNTLQVVATIHTYLEELAKKMRAGEVPVKEYAITKGLNKAPHEYPDAKAQPHLQVGLGLCGFVCGWLINGF